MNLSTSYNEKCDHVVSILAEMVVSYIVTNSQEVDKKESELSNEQSVLEGGNYDVIKSI